MLLKFCFVSFSFILYHCVSFSFFLFHLVSCCVSLFDFVALCRIVWLSCRFCNCIRIICVLSPKQQFHLEQLESMKKKVLKMKMKPCLGKMCPFRRCVTGAHQGYCCGRCRLQSGGHGPKCMMILTMKAKENQKKSFGSLKGDEEMKRKAQLFQGWCVLFKALCYVVYVKFTGRAWCGSWQHSWARGWVLSMPHASKHLCKQMYCGVVLDFSR